MPLMEGKESLVMERNIGTQPMVITSACSTHVLKQRSFWRMLGVRVLVSQREQHRDDHFRDCRGHDDEQRGH